ncbi:MAG: hypothetical protein QME25_03620 [Bacteroidota bacterium]|nr:hypothetical protein [Bacteroidota bacterium]
MKKYISHIVLFLFATNLTYSQIGGYAGAFSRMGFGSRGIGMGNSMTAVSNGEISSYYNPALIPFAEKRTASISLGFMPFDRYINFLSYSQSIKPSAGLSIGIINAGVKNIDSRDNDGYHLKYLSTSENQFYLAFGNRIHPNVSLGITVKIFYYSLYEKVSSTTVGFDLGALITATKNISIAIALQDLGSNYKWNTAAIYGQSGGQTTDKFPNLRRLAVAYKLPNRLGTIAAEFENSSVKSNFIRLGGEIVLHEYFSIRSGIDKWDVKSNTSGIKPTFGFSVNKPFDDWTPIITYAYVLEPFSSGGVHIVSLSIKF